tara:strand:+ start:160 stop:291 length:132 start_codon:yes stop_codon:yes gene_type:complete
LVLVELVVLAQWGIMEVTLYSPPLLLPVVVVEVEDVTIQVLEI